MQSLISVQKQLLEKQMEDMQKSAEEYKQKVEKKTMEEMRSENLIKTVKKLNKRVDELKNVIDKVGFEVTELNEKLISNNMAIAARIGELERRIHD